MRSRGSDESTAGPAVGASRGGGCGSRPGGRAIAAHAPRQPAGARHLPRADRDQYDRLAGEHAARRPRHGATAPRRRIPGGRRARAARPRCEARQPRGALPRHRGGGGGARGQRPGGRGMFVVQASEKVYATYVLEASDKGGHSSLPRPADNPVYRLAPVLERLAQYQFPVKLNEVSRTFFERSAALESGSLADDMRGVLKDPPDSAAVAHLSAVPFYNSKLRTTCVATMMQAGHAENALPQSARLTVNCRILPGDPASDVEATLRRLAADDRITLRATNTPTPSPPSPLTASIMGPIEQLVAEQFPGIPVVPVMEAGATDGLALRNAGIPTYGVSAVFEEQNDVRAHGRDERLSVQSFYDALEFWYRMMQVYASGRLTR